ncbi:cytochrome c biogenesis protein CcdA [Thermosynechococcus sp. JY1334]|uniref:cytochrome c biogenesis protein CcdA n=1 Tax=unclassified Thermosynechococcus TaxID=2622553 RepID=UPI0026735F79|nr:MULTISPECIES: cytochrome c biogenesis protein CcdA [unclassified Thermosynechococcus]MDR5638682.1 cytochrome c biogenesis protein CcdA [Thermosynechococcus sp. PP42]MDR7897768.1 cytochrome c biogenesis protein CcdA [Thermosynechococcus sp. JY1332]MDR7905167.1 cytochrome c biogenesis protein CcdA [Thermosynechococcus sp. JY1334]MDR7992992.1 cytochrome c biogenesis protein CcdA [Thermosynechococcus sp. TG252]WKT87386.1 cytochrome c biogenesis protein CcdA [Thermosynechococcus sp. JY1339]
MASLTLGLYHLEQWANQWVTAQLSDLTVISVGIVFLAGLLTSLTPCTLSMLPITVGYIAGYATKQNGSVLRQSLGFALGLATTLTLLGMIAAVAGRIYGQVGWGLTIVVSLVAIAMGLNLLNALPLSFPRSRFLEELPDRVPAGLQAYTLGATFGLVAAPCSTPVLATLLAWVATTQKLVVGAGLLLAYTTGYVAPLILVGVFSGALQRLLALRQWSSWITPVSGVLLIAFGVIALAIRL